VLAGSLISVALARDYAGPSRCALIGRAAMFTVNEPATATIHRAFEDGGELAGVVELHPRRAGALLVIGLRHVSLPSSSWVHGAG